MWKTYTTEQAAIADLIHDGFKWNKAAGQWHRGEPYVSQARVTVGRCADGRWLIMQAPICTDARP